MPLLALGLWWLVGSLCGCCGDQFWHSDKVVGCDCESEDGGNSRSDPDFDLGEAGLRLDPTEHLLDAIPAAQADAVAGTLGGTTVNVSFADFTGLERMPLTVISGATLRARGLLINSSSVAKGLCLRRARGVWWSDCLARLGQS